MDPAIRGILAGMIGTVFMNLSSDTEMHLRGRQPSVTPGRAANKVLRIVGVPQLEGTALQGAAGRISGWQCVDETPAT